MEDWDWTSRWRCAGGRSERNRWTATSPLPSVHRADERRRAAAFSRMELGSRRTQRLWMSSSQSLREQQQQLLPPPPLPDWSDAPQSPVWTRRGRWTLDAHQSAGQDRVNKRDLTGLIRPNGTSEAAGRNEHPSLFLSPSLSPSLSLLLLLPCIDLWHFGPLVIKQH